MHGDLSKMGKGNVMSV